LPKETADAFFERLDEDRSGVVDYREFLKHVGPYIDLPGIASAMQPPPKLAQGSSRQSRRSSRSSSKEKVSPIPQTPEEPIPDFQTEAADVDALQEMARFERELRQVMQDIGQKLPLKFKHVRDAFRTLDLAKDGKITRAEMRSFFRGFGWPEDVADRVFNMLDEEGHGEVDYNQFMAYFESVLGPANRPAPRARNLSAATPVLEREVNEIASVISEKIATKFRKPRDAFSALDLTNDGLITRNEMRVFFRTMCMPVSAADKVYDALNTNGSDMIKCDDFKALFGLGPIVRPGGHWNYQDDQRDVQNPVVWRLMG